MSAATTIVIAAGIFFGYRKVALRNKIAVITGTILLADAILVYPYLFYLGKLNLQSSLPLQLCSLSGFLSGIVLLKRSQLLFEFLLYWGLPAGFYALLTPEMTLGSEGLLVDDYYICHGGILFSALYLSIVFKMRPREYSWLRIFFYTQILLVLVAVIDWLIKANYMYLSEPPIARNPLIIGQWPLYIIMFELIGLVHFYIIYLLFQKTNRLIKIRNQ